ncbi:hypothetical protein [Streptomyces anulatus]|uniref:hypothetical protein n=1 Tax=Streptomyces anulatus TaxID=1892 RepID=UPI00333397DC
MGGKLVDGGRRPARGADLADPHPADAVARTYDISLEPVTEQLIDLVLADRAAPSGRH